MRVIPTFAIMMMLFLFLQLFAFPSHVATAHEPVLIIGAGAAGASAALHLSRSNIPFLILEATNRVGGRMRTQQLDDGPVLELGANWLQGYSKQKLHPFFAFVDEFVKLQGVVTDSDDTYFYLNGSKVPDEIADPVWRRADRAFETLHSLPESLKQVGTIDVHNARELLTGFVPREPIEIAAWRNYFDFEYAVPDNQLSVRDLSPIFDKAAPSDTVEIFVTDQRGYKAAVDVALNLAGVEDVTKSGEKLWLNSPVSRVRYSDDGATVRLRDGRKVKGSAVICTVSLGVLKDAIQEAFPKSNRLVFDPPLTLKKRVAISKMLMADYLKVFVQFKSALFTGKDPLYIVPLSCEVEDRFINIQNMNKKGYYPGENIVLITATGSYSRELNCMSDEQVLREVLGYVSLSANRKVERDEVKALLIPDYTGEFFRGSFSATAPGLTKEDTKELARAVGALFWAGEGTNQNNLNGYVHGAWETGIDAADKVIAFMKRRSL